MRLNRGASLAQFDFYTLSLLLFVASLVAMIFAQEVTMELLMRLGLIGRSTEVG